MSDIPKEYFSDDFGFTAVDDPSASIPQEPIRVPEISEVLTKLDAVMQTLENIESMVDYHPKLNKEEEDGRLQEVEKLVMPLLVNLGKNPEKEYILWPKRTEQINAFIEKLLKLTRG